MVVHEPHRFGRPAHGVRGTGLSPRTAAVCDMPPWTKVCERSADRVELATGAPQDLRSLATWARWPRTQGASPGRAVVCELALDAVKQARAARPPPCHPVAARPCRRARHRPGGPRVDDHARCRKRMSGPSRQPVSSRSRGGAVGEGLSPVVRHSPDPVEHFRGGALAGLDGAVEASDRSGTWLGEAVADLGPCGREVGSWHHAGVDAGFVHVRPDGGHGPDVDVGADEGVEAVGGVPG